MMITYERRSVYRWWLPWGEWKYELLAPYSHDTGIAGAGGGDQWAHITPTGTLHISKGFNWDGASGPAIDTPSFMRASLVHDALYQLLRRGVITDRKRCDAILRYIAQEDGMWRVRSLWVYAGVRLFGGFYIKRK